jgi:hypothetical protein
VRCVHLSAIGLADCPALPTEFDDNPLRCQRVHPFGTVIAAVHQVSEGTATALNSTAHPFRKDTHMLFVGEVVKPSGKGRTATWEGMVGTVTRVEGTSVFVLVEAAAAPTALWYDVSGH